jgi:hypothetical protein
MACTPCAQSAKNAVPADTRATFMRALLFGAGAAFAGLVFFAFFGILVIPAFGIIADLVVGCLSLGVGYIVGRTMMVGSKGIGGLRYQIATVLLTYAAVSLSAIPVGLAFDLKHRREQHERIGAEKKPADLAEEQRQLEDEFGSGSARPLLPGGVHPVSPARRQAHQPEAVPKSSAPGIGPARGAQSLKVNWLAFGYLALLGLASPLLWLQSLQGLVAFLVLVAGMMIAWRTTAARRSEIVGPFRNSPAAR